MTFQIPADLWKKLTSTVGLVSVRHDTGTNVMAAEWSYFVNKAPLYAAVVLAPQAATRDLLTSAGEFSLTLCADEQAALADFAGSFSVADIDKTSTEAIRFGAPHAITTPWVSGGVLAVECELRDVVEFPVHTMYVGEVVAAHQPENSRRPLVKHGAMHTLGEPAHRTTITAAAQLRPGNILRVAATGPAATGPWRVGLVAPDGTVMPLGGYPCGDNGDLLVDLPLPASLRDGDLDGRRVQVARDGAEPGHARVSRAPQGGPDALPTAPVILAPGASIRRHAPA
jgi:flavin reductase (DIM6/NTAB) family NADH-FMN oxidoreductase RutF